MFKSISTSWGGSPISILAYLLARSANERYDSQCIMKNEPQPIISQFTHQGSFILAIDPVNLCLTDQSISLDHSPCQIVSTFSLMKLLGQVCHVHIVLKPFVCCKCTAATSEGEMQNGDCVQGAHDCCNRCRGRQTDEGQCRENQKRQEMHSEDMRLPALVTNRKDA